MKPQTYDGTEDLDEYLTHFNIIARLNGWSKEAKSLHLAGNLAGSARALLNDLDPQKREDYESLVEALTHRYGNVNRAAVFKSQLQTRMKRKDESIPELAQSVVKLARKAYPKANPEMVDVLAVDHFIDAFPQSDIRLKLKEKDPKNIMEAEKLAVTLEAFDQADKYKQKNVRFVESATSDEQPSYEQSLQDQVRQLCQDVKEIKRWGNQRGRGMPNGRRGGYQHSGIGQGVRPPNPVAQFQGNRQGSSQGATARQ